MTGKQGGSLIRKLRLTGAVLAALCACAVALPATSSASVACGGRTTLGDSGIGDNDVQYRFGCSEKINGFGIVVNTGVSIFSDSANAFDPKTGLQIDKQSFSCEGNIPGVGVGMQRREDRLRGGWDACRREHRFGKEGVPERLPAPRLAARVRWDRRSVRPVPARRSQGVCS